MKFLVSSNVTNDMQLFSGNKLQKQICFRLFKNTLKVHEITKKPLFLIKI